MARFGGRVQFTLAVVLVFAVSTVARSDTRTFAPVAYLEFAPLPDTTDGEPEWLASEVEFTPPITRPVDEQTWIALKELAAVDSQAPAAETVAPPPGKAVSAVLTQFPGWGYQEIQPPDTTIAKSGQRVIQVINSAIALYDPSGNLLQGRTLGNFLSAFGSELPPFDPRVIFDRNATNARFFVTATQIGVPPTEYAKLFLAVSRSPNPPNLEAANWCRYGFPALDDYGSSVSTFADQPSLGVGADTLILARNHFTLAPPHAFTYAVISAFDKIGMVNNAPSCPIIKAQVFRPATSSGDLTIFGLQPALHYNSPSSFTGTTNPAYLVNTYLFSENTYWVWRVRNIRQGAAPGNLQMTSVDTAGSYGIPPNAKQPGNDPLLETGDARTLQVGAVGNSLWVAHSTYCNIGGGPTEACARIVRFNVSQNQSGGPSATVGQEVTFGGGANVFYWMPGIAVTGANRTAVPFLWSSGSVYQSSGWTVKNAGSLSYPAAQSLGAGVCTRIDEHFNDPPRTGDYVGAQTNPDLTSFWLSAEYADVYPPPPSGSECTFRTNILQVN